MPDATCSIDQCESVVIARGWCRKHYKRWHIHGDPLAPRRPYKPRLPRQPKVKKLCTVDGCGLPHYGRGWCENHYARWRRHGALHDARAFRIDPAVRFEAKLDRNGPVPAHQPELGQCWIWTGRPNGAGYGSFNIGANPIGAHVAAVILDGREVPAEMEVDHLCRTRMCARASHLEVVTHEVNIQRALVFREWPEVCLYGHDLTPENIMTSQGPRACRICFKASQRRYREKQKLRIA